MSLALTLVDAVSSLNTVMEALQAQSISITEERLTLLSSFISLTVPRVHLSKMGNGGEQKRLFSTATEAQGKKQNKMYHDKLEKRTLLNHNKKFRKKHNLC